MNDRSSKKSVGLAARAACAFTLAALIDFVPSVLLHQAAWLRISGIGFAMVAILWWAVFFQWKRKLER